MPVVTAVYLLLTYKWHPCWSNRNAENSTEQPDHHQWMLKGHVPILLGISVWLPVTKAAWSESLPGNFMNFRDMHPKVLPIVRFKLP